MPDLKECIKKKRSNLSATSVKTYDSILRHVYKNAFGEGDIDVSKFDEDETIWNKIRLLPPSRRKTILSALVIITDNEFYRDVMMDDIKDYKNEIAKQEAEDSLSKGKLGGYARC
jgi:hypothetical protein